MVGDPFADWPGTITRIKELLKTLNIKIPIETLFAEKGLRLDQEKMTVTKLERMDVDANVVNVFGFDAGKKIDDRDEDKFIPGTLAHAQAAGIRADAAAANAEALLGESEALLALLESEKALRDAENSLNASMLQDLFAKLGLDAEGNPIGTTTINVNVEGNVTSAEDLAEVITDIQYTYQKTGKGLLLQSRAI